MSNRGRDRANQLVVAEVSVDFTKHTMLLLAHEHEQRYSANKKNCDRHSQGPECSQLSYRGRNRANQLVAAETSVEFTKHTMLLLAYKHEQERQRKERIVIVTDKLVSAVNCPIKVVIVPLSWLL